MVIHEDFFTLTASEPVVVMFFQQVLFQVIRAGGNFETQITNVLFFRTWPINVANFFMVSSLPGIRKDPRTVDSTLEYERTFGCANFQMVL
jgi:hypothetical protein